jgi:probable HAF family extracellular repeat protein
MFSPRLLRRALALCVSLACVTAAQAQSYTAAPPGPGTYTDFGLAINQAGDVVGFAQATPNSYPFAALWTPASAASPARLFDLGTLGGAYSFAYGLNNTGLVTGYAALEDGRVHATVWDAQSAHDLGTLGGRNSYGNGINDSGVVVGSSELANGDQHTTLWAAGNIIDLGTLGGSTSNANAINNAGLVVGGSNVAGNMSSHATVWTGLGQMQDLGTLGGDESSALGLNELGQIVGYATTASNAHWRAALWEGGTVTDLGALNGGESRAFGINLSGQAVGWSTFDDSGATHATLWDQGQIIDLNTFLSPDAASAGWVLTGAASINDQGWIVTDARNDLLGVNNVVLLKPTAAAVPEPASLLMMGLGLAFMGLAMQRRTLAARRQG